MTSTASTESVAGNTFLFSVTLVLACITVFYYADDMHKTILFQQ